MFGGDGGPNSPIHDPNQPNSGLIMDITNEMEPSWLAEVSGWANEPSRRIRHSTSSSEGRIYIIGGERDDGSSIGYSDHYVFDPVTTSFTQLPPAGGPPDVYGHSSVVLSDGRLLVFGGYSESRGELIPFTTIWSLNTRQSTATWTTIPVDGLVPAPRRGFAAVWLSDDRVLIHGGADAELQSTLTDGWILDTSTNPMTWTSVSALTSIGPRRDHFAIQYGSLVLFGFGMSGFLFI